MSALLLITHGNLGESLLAQARHVMGSLEIDVRVLGVHGQENPDALVDAANELREQLSENLVILTDVFGATPSNIAHQVCTGHPVVHGINLAMLLRASSDLSLTEQELAVRLVEGGRQAIFSGDQPPQNSNA
ncbi:MAG: PTS sugar transporter subunit IIA [Lysobacterales bacterium]